MKAHSLTLGICLLISTASLIAGYTLAGYWLILPLFALLVTWWILVNKRSAFLSASGYLVIYFILAAAGILIKLPLGLMIIAGISALGCWDLLLFRQNMAEISPEQSGSRLEQTHLKALALASAAGLVLAMLSVYLNLQLPFLLTVFLVLLAIGCLVYGLQVLGNRIW